MKARQNNIERYTNKYTLADLFPDEDPKDALKRELLSLSIEDYIETRKDIKFPKRSDWRVFGKSYNGKGDVYIKIRVELINADGRMTTFVMSFHFAEMGFKSEDFPYRR